MKLSQLNPYRAPTDVKVKDKTQLKEALKKAGKLDRWNVETLSPQDIRNSFKRSCGEIFRETVKSTLLGARTIGKPAAIGGAIGGGLFGIVGGLIAGIAFPPSLLAIAVTVTINGALGAAIGGIGGMALGGLFKGAKTALSLILTSPRQRLMRHARTGRKELDRLEGRQMDRQLKKPEQERLEYLREHVPLWEYAAHNLQSSKSDQATETLISFDSEKEAQTTTEHVALQMPDVLPTKESLI